jgi:acyl transferase domain-containing protein
VAVGSLRRESDERAALLDTLGRLYAHGVPVRWTALYPAPRRGVRLPAYPWQRDRFWYEPDGQRASPPRRRAHSKAHPLLGDHFTSSLDPTTHFWEVECGADSSWLGEHRVDGVAMVPAAAIVELVLSRARFARPTGRPSPAPRWPIRAATPQWSRKLGVTTTSP